MMFLLVSVLLLLLLMEELLLLLLLVVMLLLMVGLTTDLLIREGLLCGEGSSTRRHHDTDTSWLGRYLRLIIRFDRLGYGTIGIGHNDRV